MLLLYKYWMFSHNKDFLFVALALVTVGKIKVEQGPLVLYYTFVSWEFFLISLCSTLLFPDLQWFLKHASSTDPSGHCGENCNGWTPIFAFYPVNIDAQCEEIMQVGRHLKRAEWRILSKQSDCKDGEVHVRKGVSVKQDEYDLEMERREASSGGDNIFFFFFYKSLFLKQRLKRRSIKTGGNGKIRFPNEVRIVLQGILCAAVIDLPFLTSQQWPGLPTFHTYRSPACWPWSETPSFKALPLHRWVLDHYHLYC